MRIGQLKRRLKGYLTQDGTGQISTISVNILQKKRIEPTKFNTQSGRSTMYVRSCLNHTDTIAVPVDLFDWDPKTRRQVPVGEAKCCPLCWAILWRDGARTNFVDEPVTVSKEEAWNANRKEANEKRKTNSKKKKS